MVETKFVAEFTTNHMGNLNLLLRMVERAARAGCDFIKMQKKDVESFYSREKLNAPYASPFGVTYRDYRSVFEFNDEDFDRFDRACREHGVNWFSTVQDLPSLDFLLRYDLPLYKIASCNSRNLELLRGVADRIPRDRTLVLSVGGSTLDEIEAAMGVLRNHSVWLLHCVARYPCPADQLRLGNIKVLRERFGSDRVTVGYSGHEEGLAGSFAAIDMGAEVVERHFCMSRHSFVHHIECSLEPDEFKKMVDTVRSGRTEGEGCELLPSSAYAAAFGMSPHERNFLVENTYGQKFIGDESTFATGDPRLEIETPYGSRAA